MGAVGSARSLPYLADLSGPGTGGRLFNFTVRSFSLAALVPFFNNAGESTRLLLVNLPLVPLNYFLEFGFFFAAESFARAGMDAIASMPPSSSTVCCISSSASGSAASAASGETGL